MKNFNNLNNLNNLNESEDILNLEEDIFKYQFLNLIISFLFSISNICGRISPFGVAICACASKEYCLATSIGALFGYLISSQNNIIYIVSIILITVARFVFENNKKILSPGMLSLSFFSCSFIFMIIFDELNFYNILINFSESVMLGGVVFFLDNLKKILKNKISYSGLSNDQITTILICINLLLIPLMSINFLDVSIGKILAIYIILFIALNLEPQTSGCVGMIISLAILLSGCENNSYIILSYGLGAFVSSLAKKYKSIGVANVFLIINSLTYILVGIIKEENIFLNLIEIIISCFLFVITSKYLKNKFFLFKEKNLDIISCENAKNLMFLKLYFASDTLQDIANTTQKLSDRLSKDFEPTIEDIYNKCADKICKTCNLRMFCWSASYNDIINSFNNMTSVLKTNGKINLSDVSNFMKQKCKNLDEIVYFVNENYNKLISQKGVNRKVDEIRSVITDQFDGISVMLKELAEEFGEIFEFDKQTAIRAKKVLLDLGFKVLSITAFLDKYNRLTIEAITSPVLIKNLDYINKKIYLKLSEVCNKDFEIPSIVKSNQSYKITIIEKAVYQIDFGATQLSCNNFKDCGDAYNYFVDSKGRAYMILSDGMGTGSQAAVDGAMTAGLLSKLIKSGFDFEAASKIVNSALLIKPGEESLSTIDVASIDLYTGQVDIFKAGAAPTFTKKSDKILEIDSTTLPAGILRGLSFDKKTIVLKNKDIIIMVSDGVTNNEYNWIYDELKDFKYNISAKELSKKIALESKFRNKLHHDDDVTVLVGIISKGA
ncbi:MAG: SpoIIE family protein phosphatase [Oscillospiraceae bacterium]|nr:SpoIIE family protein phosphatase [Oscillospiraceae bacterium]